METEDDLMYRRYRVDIQFLNGIAGGTALDKGLVANHIARFSAEVSNVMKLSKKQDGEVTEEAMKKYMTSVSSVFPLDDGGIYLRGMQFQAMLKDAGQLTKATLKKKGLGRTIRDGGVLFPPKVYLGVEPSIIERPVKPDNGPATIKIFQVAEGGKLSIPCAVLNNGDLDDKLWKQLWQVGQGIGLGANRHLDYGKFKVTDIRQEDNWNIIDLWANGTTPESTSPVPEHSRS